MTHFELTPAWGMALGLLLVALNGFFVAAEFALVKVRPTQLEPLIGEGSRRARMARHMIRHLDAYLSATQLGITLASLALGWVGEPAFSWLVRPAVALVAGHNPDLHHTVSLELPFPGVNLLLLVRGGQGAQPLASRRAPGQGALDSVPPL